MAESGGGAESGNGSVRLLDGLEPLEDAAAGVAPDWLVGAYLSVVVGGGVVANAALVSAILARKARARRRGDPHLLGLLLCLALADAASLLLVAPFEVLVLGAAGEDGVGAWTFGNAYCRVFLGLEVLVGSAAAYAILAVNLHAVLGCASALPTGSDGSGDGGGGALTPSALVWALAASLSVPAFVAADVVEARPPHALCTARSLGFPAHVLLAVFRAAVPALALLGCAAAAAVRLCGGGAATGAPGPARRESATAARWPLRVALVLGLSFAAMSLHRAVFAALHPLLPSTAAARGPAAFASPPLAAAPATPAAALAFTMLHHALPSLRPLLACLAGRGLRQQLAAPDAYDDEGACCCPVAGGGRRGRREGEEAQAVGAGPVAAVFSGRDVSQRIVVFR